MKWRLAMVLLDTNVVSEPMLAAPSAEVLAWMDDLPARRLFVSAGTGAEVRTGIAVLPEGARRLPARCGTAKAGGGNAGWICRQAVGVGVEGTCILQRLGTIRIAQARWMSLVRNRVARRPLPGAA